MLTAIMKSEHFRTGCIRTHYSTWSNLAKL